MVPLFTTEENGKYDEVEPLSKIISLVHSKSMVQSVESRDALESVGVIDALIAMVSYT